MQNEIEVASSQVKLALTSRNIVAILFIRWLPEMEHRMNGDFSNFQTTTTTTTTNYGNRNMNNKIFMYLFDCA